MVIFQEVSKNYNGLSALSDVTLDISDGEFLFLVGPTGAGKSTILKLIIREELPTAGTIVVDGFEVSSLPEKNVPHLRRKVGTVFQDFKLLSQRTVFENVAFPLEVLGLPDEEIEKATEETLKLVSLGDRANHFPNQLSGGEAQRTAIARAMVLRPEIILADEPTGNLDAGSAWEIMKLLGHLNSLGTTVIMATHNMDITSSLPHRKVELHKGRLVADSKKKGSTHTKDKSTKTK